MNNQQIIIELESLIKKLKTIQFEDTNFRINSDDWKKKTVEGKSYLENPQGDIWEILEKGFEGEQLFTWEAAIRETKKAGKTMPTREDFEKVFTDVIPDWPKAGYRDRTDGSLGSLSSFGTYWSSSPSSSNALSLFFGSTSVDPADYFNRASGFSVRCIKN
jgi:hypothetical protein